VSLLLILAALIAFIVFATAKLKLHPFIALILAAYLAGFAYGIPVTDIAKTIQNGFGGILGYIGLVIVLGTIIGVILEKSGAAIVMADAMIKLFGERFPHLTMSTVGYFVSIPVFCDSGFVILNSLKNAMARRMKVSTVSMSVALATGLYATHTFVPPTPGPIAAAANLGVADKLGWVIALGALVAAVSALAGLAWGRRFGDVEVELIPKNNAEKYEDMKAKYGKLPTTFAAFSPILVPIALICLGSVAKMPAEIFGKGVVYTIIDFLGQPMTALAVGLCMSLRLISGPNKVVAFSDYVAKGMLASAPILLTTGAGGAFGAVLKASTIGTYLGETLTGLGIGLFAPFVLAAALKTAQGSSTVAIVTTSALIASLLPQLGLDSDMGRVLAVLATGAGAMTVSHANDSFFWVVSQFSGMGVDLAYRAHTIATLIQGVTAMATVYILSLILL